MGDYLSLYFLQRFLENRLNSVEKPLNIPLSISAIDKGLKK